jgi:hypothetical protein
MGGQDQDRAWRCGPDAGGGEEIFPAIDIKIENHHVLPVLPLGAIFRDDAGVDHRYLRMKRQPTTQE